MGGVNKSEGNCCRVRTLIEGSIMGPWIGGGMRPFPSGTRPIPSWRGGSEFALFCPGAG